MADPIVEVAPHLVPGGREPEVSGHTPWKDIKARRAGLTFSEVTAINWGRCIRWHEDSSTAWTGADWGTAMGGECGEALNVIKKLRRLECGMPPGPDDPPEPELKKMLADELADTFLYLDLLASFYDVDLPAAIVSKFNRVSARQGFPERLPA